MPASHQRHHHHPSQHPHPLSEPSPHPSSGPGPHAHPHHGGHAHSTSSSSQHSSHHLHHSGPGSNHSMHPHAAYGQPMPPPPSSMPPPQMNGSGPGPASSRILIDGPPGQGPHPGVPRSSSASSHLMDAPGPVNGSPAGQGTSVVQKLSLANEQTWIAIGGGRSDRGWRVESLQGGPVAQHESILLSTFHPPPPPLPSLPLSFLPLPFSGSAAEAMEDFDRALSAYESALRHNPYSVPAMSAIAGVHRTMDHFERAVEYFQRVLNIVPENGETWGAMGHCYLMMDDLQKAYTAYQQALYHLPNPKEPKLWYGIGILYDRYGSLEHAEEAFASVVRMDPNYEKANEIYFRLGIIYKQQNKYSASLECFRYILSNPPRPLTEIDIWFQIGHVYEQQKDFSLAKEAYERVLAENPSHAKVLQQLGWLYHQSNAGFTNQERAIQFLTKSLESDPNDSQSWYLLGRAYMAGQNYNKAYEAYQQAVYRDGKNPTFWCSIGVLYYQINQFRDALDAYSRAIRLNPYISEVWFDLGSLYESCNNQISDAIDAYARAAELDPDNPHIQQRLMLLRNAEAKGEQVPSAPMPQDVHPTAYASGNMAPGPPAQIGGAGPGVGMYPPGQGGPQLPPAGPEASDPRDLPGPVHLPQTQSPSFRGGPPPAIPNIDERGTRGPNHTPLAPMNAAPSGDAHHRGYPHSRGPSPGPRLDPYGRRMASPPRHSPPPPLRHDMHDPHYGPPHGGPPPLDPYGRPIPVSMAEREREMEWERERERARQYPPSGRITPKDEPPYPPQVGPRSQHGSNAPSPAYSRPAAYPRDDPRGGDSRDYATGPYDRPRPMADEQRPPYDYDRGYPPPPGPGGPRYDPLHDRLDPGPGPRPADPRGPSPERERPREHPQADSSYESAPATASKAKGRKSKSIKEDVDSVNPPASPAPSATGGGRKRKDGPSSRAGSPWGGGARGGTAQKTAPSRADSKPPVGGKKAGAQWRSKGDGASAADSRGGSPDARSAPHTRTPSHSGPPPPVRAPSPAGSDVSAGSNEPLAARGPSRIVDEDYDDSAADALMGLAGAASASASMPPKNGPPAAARTPPRVEADERAETGRMDPPRSSPQKPSADHDGAASQDKARSGSSLGKRPYDEIPPDEAAKRARNGSPFSAKNGEQRDDPRKSATPTRAGARANGGVIEDSEMTTRSPPPASVGSPPGSDPRGEPRTEVDEPKYGGDKNGDNQHRATSDATKSKAVVDSMDVDEAKDKDKNGVAANGDKSKPEAGELTEGSKTTESAAARGSASKDANNATDDRDDDGAEEEGAIDEEGRDKKPANKVASEASKAESEPKTAPEKEKAADGAAVPAVKA
ncbi:hypothetical protein IE53DRAFT_136811 [Violaceomyces palustris]|uniref:Uncharacterized protein n=1 Tax=Violaceomyces palustris TaxID=1673888 RepID=A0ACD0P6H3_9BASI|nr:hypothetical protein IE53DRAFT_136811 [Violaceomyces palustris]